MTRSQKYQRRPHKVGKRKNKSNNELPYAPIIPGETPYEERHHGWLALIALIVLIMCVIGFDALIQGAGFAHVIKILIYAFAVSALSYGGSKAVITKGAVHAARGSLPALVLSIGFLLALGGLIGSITGSAMTRDLTEQSELQKPLLAINSSLQHVNKTSLQGERVIPLMRSASEEIRAIIQCEREGCITGRNGIGSEVLSLQQLEIGYFQLINRFREGKSLRERLTKNLIKASTEYEAILNRDDLSSKARRNLLHKVYSKASTAMHELSLATPISAAKSFISKLRSVNWTVPITAKINVNDTLQQQANALENALDFDGKTLDLPPFPANLSITSGWNNLSAVWPLLLIAFGLELPALIMFLGVYAHYSALYDEELEIITVQDELDDDPTDNRGATPPLEPSNLNEATEIADDLKQKQLEFSIVSKKAGGGHA